MFGKSKEIEITFTVEGMMCPKCQEHVENALFSVKGTKAVVVDLETKKVSVLAKASVTEDALKSAVTAAGYKVN